MKKLFVKESFYSILVGLFIGCLIVANILAGRIWTVYGEWTLTGGVFIFPFVFVINDLLAEVYGLDATKKAIYLGFFVNTVAVLFFTLINVLPSPLWANDIADGYRLVLGTTWRALLASMLGYLFGNLTNALIMDKMKKKHGKKLFKTRAIISTIFGELLDSLLFVFVMFIGRLELTQMLFMIILQVIVKTLVETLVLPITHKLVKRLN